MIGENMGRMFLLMFLFSSGVSTSCSIRGSCITEGDNLVETIMDVLDEDLCRELCLQNAFCSQYSWFDMTATITKNSCSLFSSCEELDLTCQGCSTGPPLCYPEDCQTPEQQKHGDWFCPEGTTMDTTCHLECHPGYVSDKRTVITCHLGEWTSSPTCVKAIALITGRLDPSPSTTVEIYGEGIHKKLPDLPDNRGWHSLDLVDSYVLLCGGTWTTSCLVLTESLQWTDHSTTTSPRERHLSISMMGQLHLLGGAGWEDPSTRSTTEHLTPPSPDWISGFNLLEHTWVACAAKIGPEEFIVTGGNEHPIDVISYNVVTGASKKLQNLKTPRTQHGCTYIRDSNSKFRGVLLAGGFNGHSATSSSEMYDMETGEWSDMGNLTTERDGVSVIVLGEDIFAMGGKSSSYLSSVDKFNLTSKSWKSGEDMLDIGWLRGVTGVPPNAVGLGQN